MLSYLQSAASETVLGSRDHFIVRKNVLSFVHQYSVVLSLRLQRLQAITCGQGLSSASLRRVHTTPNTMTNLVLPTPPGPSECLICSELALLVLFCPCQHSVACEGEWRAP